MKTKKRSKITLIFSFLIIASLISCSRGGGDEETPPGGDGDGNTTTLSAPGNVAATDGTYTDKVSITWTVVTGATTYNVYRSETSSGTYTKLGENTTPSYDDNTVTQGQYYYYKVSAANSSTESSLSSYDEGYAGSSVTVSWTANREKAVNRVNGGYRVYYSQTSGFSIGSALVQDVPYVSGTQAPTSTTINLTLGTWYAKIVAYGQLSGSTNITSAESSQSTLTVE